MPVGSFNEFDSIADNGQEDQNSETNNQDRHAMKLERLQKRERLADLLEARKLRSEIDGYDDHFNQKGNYYSDDIYDD